MGDYISLRTKARIQNSLVILLQAVLGRRTVVELRNESTVVGKIESVDDCMNTSLSNVVFKTLNGTENRFTHFYIQGRNIRYIHIPDDIDMMKAIQKQLDIAKGKRTKGLRESKEVRKEMRKQKNKEIIMRKTMHLRQKLEKMEKERQKEQFARTKNYV